MSQHAPDEDPPAANTHGGDDLLAALTDDFLRRRRSGEAPSVEEYASKHPDLAGRIRELFPLMLAMEHPQDGATLDAPQSTERVGATIGRYKLLERIGEGGFGVVYMAEQIAPVRRKVALKVIKPGYDTRQVIARFEAERQALALMDHENIAKVLDAGATESGRPYFVMELVHGVPITDYCDRNELAPRERLELFVQVCRAVQHAHTKGIIHRDIKPTNVLVTLHEGVAVPKVIDFGVAKATGHQLTEKTLFTNFAQMVGTPLYMSPEQAEMTGMDVDTRSDVYSLGVLLYELLTGTTPLNKDRLKQSAFDEIRRIIREEEPPRPSTRLSTLGDQAKTISARRKTDPVQLSRLIRGELDWIVMKSLEKDRQRRYETANGLVRDIERYLNNDPVEACPPSATYRLRKFAKRNRVALAMGALVTVGLLALVTALAVSNVLIRRHSHAREVALREKSEALDVAKTQEAAAVRERQRAEHESQMARHAGAQSEARLFLQQRELPRAIERANDAYRLGGEWEDGLLLHEIAAAARQNWVLTARIPVIEIPAVSCIVAAEPHPWLVISTRDGLRVFDSRTGKPQGTAATAHAPHHLLPTTQKTGAAVVAVSDSDVTLLSLPALTPLAARSFSDPITQASIGGSSSLLLLHRSGTVQMVRLPEFADVDSFVWNETAAIKQSPLPNQLAVSPDGMLALMHGGRWWQRAVLWDRRAGAVAFTAQYLRAHRFQFINDTDVASWFCAGEDNEVHVYSFDDSPGSKPRDANDSFGSWHGLFNDDIKQPLAFSAWTSGSTLRVALVGVSGLLVTPFDSDLSRISDRYDNLMPHEPVPSFLAFDGPSRTLALAGEKQLLLFGRQRENERFNAEDYCATACRDGLLHAQWYVLHGGKKAVGVTMRLVPFDARRSPATSSLEWPDDGIWMPWAVAAARDGATVAVIAQEMDSLSFAGARYGRVRALIYHPRTLEDGGVWKLDRAFELDAGAGAAARFASIGPDARTLVYWTADSGSVNRYDPRDGRLLGQMECGPVAARSSDGARVATVIDGRRLRVYEIAGGQTLLDIPVRGCSALCFTNDGSGIVASEGKLIVTYAIDSGRVMASVSSDTELAPLASLPGANRLLAYRHDERGAGGAIVLADSSSGKVVYTLSRADKPVTPAFFSESGRELMITSTRWSVQVMRSLRPEELAGALDAHLTQFLPQDIVATLPRARVVTTAPVLAFQARLPVTRPSSDALDPLTLTQRSSLMGQAVTVQGRVRYVSATVAHNAINIEFAGGDAHSLMIWLPPDTYLPLAKMLGRNAASSLQGHTILVRGRLGLYGGFREEWKDRLQVTVTDPHQLWIVDDDEQTPQATRPPTTHP